MHSRKIVEMGEIRTNKGAVIKVLEAEDVIELHEILSRQYEKFNGMEPISPPGVKNRGLLESAVHRQTVGIDDYYKYDTYYKNCATLVFGVVKNHAFHNGNKRVGLLCLIKHLYLNGYVLTSTLPHAEVFELMRSLADAQDSPDGIQKHANAYLRGFYKSNKKANWDDELVIDYLSYWILKNSESKNNGGKKSAYKVSDVRHFLIPKGLEVEQNGRELTISKKGNFSMLFGLGVKRKSYNMKNLNMVSIELCELIRRDFGLTRSDGWEDRNFYNDEKDIDEYIMAYKAVIYRLAKT